MTETKRSSMKERSVLKTLTSALILAVGARLSLHAQEPQPFQGVVGRTLAESKEWWPEPVKAPSGAPNVVWILIDDVGFGAAGTFGGLIQTPTFDNLANNGLRYTNFHTCAICAPTRSALLTGRNSASVHESGFSHVSMSAGFPGWDGRVPATAGTIAEILRDNGYNTFAVGKYGVTASRRMKRRQTPARSIIGRPARASITSSDFWDRPQTNTSPTWWRIRHT
jgi:arylsulfatase